MTPARHSTPTFKPGESRAREAAAPESAGRDSHAPSGGAPTVSEHGARGHMPGNVIRYALSVSWRHQLVLVGLSAIVFLMEVMPLELQRRIIDDLVKHRTFSLILLLCGAYAGVILTQGSVKLALNIYRAWVGESAKRYLRSTVLAHVNEAEAEAAVDSDPEIQGVGASMVVSEVEPIGNFIGLSISEPLLHGGIMLSVLAYITHVDYWMSVAAILIFLPQFVFVPLMQRGINRRSGLRVRVLRRASIGIVSSPGSATGSSDTGNRYSQRAFELNMGALRLKFTMNFLMNLSNHFQVVAALAIGGWAVYSRNLEVGGVVAFISGIARLKDPWDDVVNYFREYNVTQVKYRLLSGKINELREGALPNPTPR